MAPKPSPDIIQKLQDGVPPALALLAGMQLDVFTALAATPRTAADVAQALALNEERLSRLLHALVLTGLIDKTGELFANTDEAETYLVKGRPAYVGGSHEITSDIWRADLNTADSIRRQAPAALHDFSKMSDAALSAFLRGLVPYAEETGRQLATQFDPAGRSSVIDVGGGSGAALAALLDRHQTMQGCLFELPRVAQVAAPILRDLPAADRITIDEGDILADPPKGQHDIALMRALVQVLSPDDAARAIANTARCLRPGGILYITGTGIIEDDRLSPAAGIYLNLTLMNFYPNGTAHTVSDHFRWLAEAGCIEPRHKTLPHGPILISAVKADVAQRTLR